VNTGGGTPSAEVLKEAKVDKFIKVLVEELQQNKGRAVVIAGRRQSPDVHALVARINSALGAIGQTIDYHEDPEPDRPRHVDAIKTLVGELNGPNRVKTLVILGGNPVYDAPVDLDFAAALAKAETSVHLSEYVNETSQKASWHIPRSHFLETWGDTRTWDGTITVGQPLIAPLYGGLSSIELLSMLLGEERTGEELVRATHEELGVGGNWRQIVHDGFVPNTGLPVAQVQLAGFTPAALSATAAGGSAFSCRSRRARTAIRASRPSRGRLGHPREGRSIARAVACFTIHRTRSIQSGSPVSGGAVERKRVAGRPRRCSSGKATSSVSGCPSSIVSAARGGPGAPPASQAATSSRGSTR